MDGKEFGEANEFNAIPFPEPISLEIIKDFEVKEISNMDKFDEAIAMESSMIRKCEEQAEKERKNYFQFQSNQNDQNDTNLQNLQNDENSFEYELKVNLEDVQNVENIFQSQNQSQNHSQNRIQSQNPSQIQRMNFLPETTDSETQYFLSKNEKQQKLLDNFANVTPYSNSKRDKIDPQTFLENDTNVTNASNKNENSVKLNFVFEAITDSNQTLTWRSTGHTLDPNDVSFCEWIKSKLTKLQDTVENVIGWKVSFRRRLRHVAGKPYHDVYYVTPDLQTYRSISEVQRAYVFPIQLNNNNDNNDINNCNHNNNNNSNNKTNSKSNTRNKINTKKIEQIYPRPKISTAMQDPSIIHEFNLFVHLQTRLWDLLTIPTQQDLSKKLPDQQPIPNELPAQPINSTLCSESTTKNVFLFDNDELNLKSKINMMDSDLVVSSSSFSSSSSSSSSFSSSFSSSSSSSSSFSSSFSFSSSSSSSSLPSLLLRPSLPSSSSSHPFSSQPSSLPSHSSSHMLHSPFLHHPLEPSSNLNLSLTHLPSSPPNPFSSPPNPPSSPPNPPSLPSHPFEPSSHLNLSLPPPTSSSNPPPSSSPFPSPPPPPPLPLHDLPITPKLHKIRKYPSNSFRLNQILSLSNKRLKKGEDENLPRVLIKSWSNCDTNIPERNQNLHQNNEKIYKKKFFHSENFPYNEKNNFSNILNSIFNLQIRQNKKNWKPYFLGWKSLDSQYYSPGIDLLQSYNASWQSTWTSYISHTTGTPTAAGDQAIQKVLDVRFHSNQMPQLVCGCNEGPNELLLFDLKEGKAKELSGHNCQIQAVEYAMDGSVIVSCGQNILKLWNSENGECLSTLGPNQTNPSVLGHTQKITAISVNKHMDSLVASCGSCRDDKILIWNLNNHELASHLNYTKTDIPLHNVSMEALNFVSEIMLVCGSDTTSHNFAVMQLWDISTQSLLSSFAAHDSFITSIQSNKDSTVILSGSGDGSLGLFDVRTKGKSIARIPIGKHCEITTVGFSPCENYFHASCTANCALVWDIRRMERKPRQHASSSFSFLPSLNAYDDVSVLPLHCLSHGNPMPTVSNAAQRHGFVDFGDEGVNDAKWFHNSSNLVTVSGDGSLAIWDVSLGLPCVRKIVTHSRSINTVAISPDDKYISTGGDDQKVVLYRNVGVGGNKKDWKLTHPLQHTISSFDHH